MHKVDVAGYLKSENRIDSCKVDEAINELNIKKTQSFAVTSANISRKPSFIMNRMKIMKENS